MNIEHLRYVLAIERAGSISQAAENLYMGQPNLSKALKELEQTLNITIFKRSSKGAELTQKGREFVRYAQSILQQYEELEALGQKDETDQQILRVSVPRASYIVAAFTNFLMQLDMGAPALVDFHETNALRTIRRVSNGQSCLGVIRCKTSYQDYFTSVLAHSGLSWQPLFESQYLVLLAHSHPLAGEDIIDLAELHPYLEIVHGDTALSDSAGSVAETEFDVTSGNKKVQVYERGSQFDILARVPGSFIWVSPMPDDLLERNGLLQKPCTHSAHFSDFLIYREDHHFTPQEQCFVALLEKEVEKILNKAANAN